MVEERGGGVERGLVLRSTGSWYEVERAGGEVISCRARGKIRLKGVRTTNPIAVGDRVDFRIEGEGEERVGIIEHIGARDNYIIRRATNLSKESHILGANLDLSLLFLTLHSPATPLEFADRFLATAYAYRVPVLVVLPKSDLLEEQTEREAIGVRAIYEEAGYEVVTLSSVSGEGVDRLRDALRGKKTLVVGQSGCGKSAFINTLEPRLALLTQPLTQTLLGKHTTTFAEMFRLSYAPDTYVIDSPGIKGFGVIDFDRGEIAHFFPEIFSLSAGCRFHNCLHDREPGCNVVRAYEQGALAPSRYESYLSLLYDEGDKYR